MNILAISDLHGSTHKALNNYLKNNKIDLIVIAGDITHFGPAELAEDILNEISSYDIPVVAIPGNCDPQGVSSQLDNSNAINIHGKSTAIKNVGICGFGGSNLTPFDTPLEFGEIEIFEELDKIMVEMKDQDIKILVTHAPPLNTNADKLPNGDHVGSESIRKIIEDYKPNINICGHIHEAQSIDQIGETIILNPGQIMDGGACLVQIDDETNIIDSKIIKL
ncbi:MAG: metallophosphoesterase [Methanobacteriaceae archaeon]|nr:metallophosphoesterase [Methanobacteriaceae archaeon]MDO9626506.1 metallophosphoesterase [Methanobacteriaceae archaeon]